ncbi:MAG: SHOCT domain-containing protein [Chlorobi bacterium]|nr:SHOCT domain-containing protein [Chlorobiota bacterium]
MMNGMFGGGMWFSWLFWIVLLVVIVWGIVQFINRNQLANSNNGGNETPLDILKKRYAKGEITKEQFDEMRKDL